MEKKDARLTIRLSGTTKKEFEAAAAQLDRSASWLAVHILEKWLKHRHRRKSK